MRPSGSCSFRRGVSRTRNDAPAIVMCTIPGSRKSVSAGVRTTVKTAIARCPKNPAQSLARRLGDKAVTECESKSAVNGALGVPAREGAQVRGDRGNPPSTRTGRSTDLLADYEAGQTRLA